MDGNGARVLQPLGDVFYRVEPGGPFVVATPAGDVTVLGTCFRVEVMDMKASKPAITGAVVGAAITATVLVTVYEGRVLLANEKGKTEVKAGERATAGSGGAPGPAVAAGAAASATKVDVPLPAPPPDNATREELLARDRAQREELAKLRAQVATLSSDSDTGKRHHRDGDTSYFAPTKDELLEMAKNCTVKFDIPPIGGNSHDIISTEDMDKLNITTDEKAALDRTLDDLHAKLVAQLRALYVELTGNAAMAEELAPLALEQEISEKSTDADRFAWTTLISRERAGLAQPPANLAARPPVERMYRLLTSYGDQVEQAFANVVGADRAHGIRAANNGWGSQYRSGGCRDEKPE
jgi:hypothetical protein